MGAALSLHGEPIPTEGALQAALHRALSALGDAERLAAARGSNAQADALAGLRRGLLLAGWGGRSH